MTLRNNPGFPPEPPDDVERDILNFFRDYQFHNGRPPTIREVENHVSALNSTSAVKYRLDRLVDKGLLRRWEGPRRSSRTYYLPPETTAILDGIRPVLPVYGYITASGQDLVVYNETVPEGQPLNTIPPDPEYVEDWVDLEDLEGVYFDTRRYFALRVRGSSMEDRRIFNDDIVVFRRIEEPPLPGKIVAVYVTGSRWLTLKEFGGVRDGKVILKPANRAEGLEPIQVPANQANFQGVAVLVLRRLEDGNMRIRRIHGQ